MRNQDLRQRMKNANLRYWQVAEAIGISSYTFSVWLRQELNPERRERVERAIEKLESGQVEGGAA